MRARFVIDNASWSRVQLGLQRLARRVPDHAARTIRRAALRIVKRAKNYVPEETGALRDSIRIEESRGVRGRLELRVVAGGQVVERDGRTVDLDQYAAIVHEAYELMLVYGPGERTLEKMAQFPGKVGSGFLTRAADEEKSGLDRAATEAVNQVIKSEGFG